MTDTAIDRQDILKTIWAGFSKAVKNNTIGDVSFNNSMGDNAAEVVLSNYGKFQSQLIGEALIRFMAQKNADFVIDIKNLPQVGAEGVRISLYFINYDKYTTKMRIIFFPFGLYLIFAGFWFSILHYAFDTDTALTIGKGIDAIFYGNRFESALLFLFLHAFFVRGGIYTVMLQLYFTFFVKEN